MKRTAFARTVFVLSVLLLPAFSCKTAPAEEGTASTEPASVKEAPASTEAAPVNTPATEEPVPPVVRAEDPAFDPGSISREVYDSTRDEVRKVIDELNRICTEAGRSATAERSYHAWLTWLTDEYAEHTKDPEYLALLSRRPALTSRNIPLGSQRDYFINVFAASRQNVKLDDIEFTGPRRVIVWGINREERSVPQNPVLQQDMLDQGYELVRIGNQNKLVRTIKVRYYVLEKEDKWKIASLDDE
jgi:hypothetical protein